MDSLVCPACRGPLTAAPAGLACAACHAFHPIEEGVADFTGGVYYDEFTGPECLTPAHLEGLAHEDAGAAARIDDFYGPLLAARRTADRALRVLDSGCGNGMSVDRLAELGFDAWGHDLSRLRRWQWSTRRRERSGRLLLADARRLPFPDGFFDAVLSSGVIEHVGVEETGVPRYAVAPAPGRDLARRTFLSELLRVTAPGGALFLDCPNGAFPIDFWHGDRPGGARLHSPREGFLPTAGEIRRLVARLGPYRAVALSPHRRLRMRQVGRHWFGRLFRLPMAGLLRAMSLPGFGWLAESPLNPYLVLKIEADRGTWGPP